MADTLEEARAKTLASVSDFVGPLEPQPLSLADVRSATLKVSRDQDPVIKKELFEKRQQRMKTPIITSPGKTLEAEGMGVVGGLVKGLFSPIAAFMPDAFNDRLDAWEEDATRKALGMISKSQYKTAYEGSPKVTAALTGGGIGELAGQALPLAVGYGAARSLFKVGEAASFTSQAARSMLAGAATGGLFSAAAKLDPGESRFAKVATDSVTMGAFEMVGIPAMMKAWREESPAIAEAVTKHLEPRQLTTRIPEVREEVSRVFNLPAGEAKQAGSGMSVEAVKEAARMEKVPFSSAKGERPKEFKPITDVEAQLTAIRAGVPASDHVVDAVINVAKGNPELESTPIVLQAVKQKEAKRKLTQPKTVIDHLVNSEDDNFAGRVMVSVEGQPAGQIDIRRDPTNPQAASTQVDSVKQQIQQLVQTGQNVEVTHVIAGNASDAGEILNALQGRKRKAPNPDKKKRKIPGAAPPASLAENGDVPAVGTKVTIAEPDKPLVQGTVVNPESPTPKVETSPVPQKVQGRPRGAFKGVFDEPVLASKQPLPKGRVYKTEEAAADAFARRTDGTVSIEMPDKTIRNVPFAQVQVPLEVGIKQSVTLKPHLDGSDRHGIIHLDEGNISFEGRGSPQDGTQNFFRSGQFASTEPDVQWGRDPRLFIHKDAGITISVPPLRLFDEPKPGMVRLYRGEYAIDQGSAKLAHEKQSGTFFSNSYHDASSYANSLGNAGHVFHVDVTQEEAARLQMRNDHPWVKNWGVDESLPYTEGGTLRQYAVPKRKANAARKGAYAAAENPWAIEDLPELVTAKRAAKVLLNNGISPDTPVLAGVARGVHDAEDVYSGRTTFKSLKELAEVKLPLANMQELQDAAAARGLKAIPYGTQVTLQSKSYSRTFAHSLEAHEAVLRMPDVKSGAKVEAELEKAWKMGSERAWDPDVDVNKYLPLQMQEQGVTEVAQGKRPLTVVYTKDAKALTQTVRQLEQNIGVPENTFKVQLTPAMDSGGRTAAVLYNQDLVATQAAKYRDSLSYLGVFAKDPSTIIQQLSTKGKGHGIYVLAGRDGESAALYAKLRDAGSKEIWEMGRIETDTLGPYRRYNKTMKSQITYSGAGDERYIPQDLSDTFSPPDVHFAADSGVKPRAAEEMAPYEPDLSFGKQPPRWSQQTIPGVPKVPPGEFKDTSGPMAKVFGLRFRPMMELSKDLQNRTGVPFYEWYRAIEVGRNKVDQVANPILAGIRELAKPLTRKERQEAQLLFEGRIAGADVSRLEAALPAHVLDTVERIHATYNDFFKSEGFSDADVKEFFALFPTLRKSDGDFRHAITGRAQVPRIGQLLSKDMQNGVINIDARELDFQRIANRIVRSTATERYLQPSWKRVQTELEAFGQAKRIPQDYTTIFTKYMQEVLHIPDDLHMSLSRGVKQVAEKLGGRLSEVESQDAVSMLVQMNYFSNLAWQPGQVLRNYLQTLQTSAPIVGMNDFTAGFRMGLKWWKSKELQEKMVRIGLIQPDSVYQPLQEVSRLVQGGGPSKTAKAMDVFFNQGTRWHATADDFNKVVAFHSQYIRAKRVGQEYLDKKITWGQFVEKSKLDMRDAPNGPFIQEIQKAMQSGDLEKAANRMGEEFAKSTQFVYTRGNAPYVMQSTLGRFLLQYGTWPAWYTENLRNMLVRGSYKNRVEAIARWTGIQTAMFGTANALFGVDMARWTFFSPLGYQGGPFMQMGIQAGQVLQSTVDPSSNDPVARIAKARLLSGAVKQITPLPIGAATNAFESIRDLNSGAWSDAARQVLGLPPAKGPLLP